MKRNQPCTKKTKVTGNAKNKLGVDQKHQQNKVLQKTRLTFENKSIKEMHIIGLQD